jgi:uncharacterized protein (DUF1778 family)
MTDTSKITTRLRPDVDRRLRAAAALRRTRLSRVINEALDQALPTLSEIGEMVTGTAAAAGEEACGDGRA